MPKIENSFAKKGTPDFTSFHPEFSIFVHNERQKQRKTKFLALFRKVLT
jgi:hypothetical protein